MNFPLPTGTMAGEKREAGPDFALLSTLLQDWQSQSPTSRAERECRQLPAAPGAAPLAEILSAGPQWRDAVAAQGGCFSPGLAGKRRLQPSP